MESRVLGRTGFTVSALSLGTMTWGGDTDIYEARDQFTTYVDAGGRLVDTADVYNEGVAEEFLGDFLREHPDVLVSTKAGSLRGQPSRNTSRGYLLNALDSSLRRLRRSHVDIWHVHTWDSNTPLDETLSALDLAVSSGRTRYVGVSNYSGWQLGTASTQQKAHHSPATIASSQVEYSLLQRGVEREVIPSSLAHGIGTMAWSPLGRGVLSGKYRHNTPADSRGATRHFSGFVAPYLDERSRGIVEAVCLAAEALNVTPIDVSLAWLLNRPTVTTAIIGARTDAQLRLTLQGLGTTIPPEVLSALDDISIPARSYPEYGWNQS